jgi:hypothetical protein
MNHFFWRTSWRFASAALVLFHVAIFTQGTEALLAPSSLRAGLARAGAVSATETARGAAAGWTCITLSRKPSTRPATKETSEYGKWDHSKTDRDPLKLRGGGCDSSDPSGSELDFWQGSTLNTTRAYDAFVKEDIPGSSKKELEDNLRARWAALIASMRTAVEAVRALPPATRAVLLANVAVYLVAKLGLLGSDPAERFGFKACDLLVSPERSWHKLLTGELLHLNHAHLVCQFNYLSI